MTINNSRNNGARVARQAAALMFAAVACVSVAAGVLYWSTSAIDAADRVAARAVLSGPAPWRLLEQRVATKYLSSCVEVMSHWTFTVEPTADRLPLAVNCQDLAHGQAKWDQPSAEAMLVHALIQSHAGNDGTALRYVAQAQELAPRDLWNAVKRIELVLGVVEAPRLGDFSDYFAKEFQVLTDTNGGVDTAVSLYTKYPSLRPALLSIADDMGGEQRLRFINRIRNRLEG